MQYQNYPQITSLIIKRMGIEKVFKNLKITIYMVLHKNISPSLFQKRVGLKG